MLDRPLGTITTKDRFGLVKVILDIKGEKYIIYDIFLRMLKPEELKLMQGFPRDYIINRDYNFKLPGCKAGGADWEQRGADHGAKAGRSKLPVSKSRSAGAQP